MSETTRIVAAQTANRTISFRVGGPREALEKVRENMDTLVALAHKAADEGCLSSPSLKTVLERWSGRRVTGRRCTICWFPRGNCCGIDSPRSPANGASSSSIAVILSALYADPWMTVNQAPRLREDLLLSTIRPCSSVPMAGRSADIRRCSPHCRSGHEHSVIHFRSLMSPTSVLPVSASVTTWSFRKRRGPWLLVVPTSYSTARWVAPLSAREMRVWRPFARGRRWQHDHRPQGTDIGRSRNEW